MAASPDPKTPGGKRGSVTGKRGSLDHTRTSLVKLNEVGETAGLGLVSMTVKVIGHDGQALKYGLHASRSLREQVEAIHEDIGDPARSASDCALFAPWNHTYITAESWLEGIPTWLDSEKDLKLVLKPGLEVRELLTQLRDGRDKDECKRIAFNLNKQEVPGLQSGLFTEEFVAQDGLTALLELVNQENDDEDGRPTKQSSALQGYCLQSLRTALCWQSAMWQMGQNEAFLLFELLYSTHAKVRRRDARGENSGESSGWAGVVAADWWLVVGIKQ